MISRNKIRNQGTTMDGPGQSWSPLAVPNVSLGYFGAAKQISPTELELVGSTLGESALYTGMGLAVMAGTGVEQIRRIVDVHAGRFVTLDSPFIISIDHTSVVALTLYRHHIQVVSNTFTTEQVDIMLWVYGGCSECSVSYNDGFGNQPANASAPGLALWPRSIHGMIEPVHRSMLTDNNVDRFGLVGLVGGLENYLPLLRNCSLATGRSVVIRRNVVSEGLVVTPSPTSYLNVIGAILEGNRITRDKISGHPQIAVTNSTSRLVAQHNLCHGGSRCLPPKQAAAVTAVDRT
jgi:hypothetical protein